MESNQNQKEKETLTLAKPFANTFRFNFSDSILEKLTQFSKINKSCDRHAFKEAWKEWLTENADIVSEETQRLITLGYSGDVTDKMYMSVRYYFRKKKEKMFKQDKDFFDETHIIESNPDPTIKSKNIPTNRLLLDAMNEHIFIHCQDPNYRPANGFEWFCRDNIQICKEEVKRLINEQRITKRVNIQEKMKKTYKNRYYSIKKKCA